MYNAKEKFFLIILFFAALISFFFFINFRSFAFPEHNIKFDITREQAAEKSHAFVSGLGFNPDDFKETTVFTIDEESKTYLEREVGVKETAKLASNDINIWHFTTRFYKPLEKEEISVVYLPNGRFSGYSLAIDESEKGASLSKAFAQKRAETFLTNAIHADIQDWKLVSGESIERRKRVDHTFIWEKKNFSAKDATYRMEVHIYGDKIGGYLEYLKIPEDWIRAYENETSNNDLAQTIAESLMFLLFGLAIIVTFIVEYRRNNLRLAQLRILGLTAAGIAALTALNSLPLSLSGYPTTMSWEAFLGSIIVLSILGGFFEGASVLLIVLAGEAKFREVFPNKLSIEASIKKAVFTKEINKALFVGVFFGIIFFAYEVAYYFLGKNLGFWAPADINYADIVSTILPWLYPLFIGFMAAATEEGIFRLFGIPFLKKYVKSTWAAIFITAIIWAFLHSNYPQSPWYVRGIEISVIGIVLGWLFVRFGFIASFSAHYTFNALQTAIFFYASGNLYASISGTLVSLLPLVIAVGLLVRAYLKKGFSSVKKEYYNSNIVAKQIVEKKKSQAVIERKYLPLSSKRKAILIGLSILSAVALWQFYPQTSLQQVPTSLDRNEVIEVSDKAMSEKKIAFGDYKKVASFNPQDISTEEDYILEKEDYTMLKKIYPKELPLALWSVRYFKPLQKEEYVVELLPDGTIYQIFHIIDEKARGKNLTTNEARNAAEKYLIQEKRYEMNKYRLVETKAVKQEKRTDHIFVYEEKSKRIGKEATFRTEISVVGDEVVSYNKFLKLPESWLREHAETTTLDFVIFGIVIVFSVFVVSLMLKAFLDLIREKKIDFPLAYKLAGVVTFFSIVAILNGFSKFYEGYDTAIPLMSYIVQSIFVGVISFVLAFFLIALIFGTFLALWKQFVGQIIPQDSAVRKLYINDALLAGYSVPVIMTGISSVLLYILLTQDLSNSLATFDTFPQLDTFVPFISVLSEFPMALGGLCLAGIAALVLKKFFKTWKKVLILLTIVALLLAIPQQQTVEDMVIEAVENLILLYSLVTIVALILRRNIHAYAVSLYSSLLFASGWVLFEQSNLFFRVNGSVLFIFALIPVLVYFILGKKAMK